MERTALRRPLGSPTPASSTVSDSKIILVHVGLQARKIGDGEINRPNLSLSLINRASGPPGLRASNVRPVSPCPRAHVPPRGSVALCLPGQQVNFAYCLSLLHLCTRHRRICTFARYLHLPCPRASMPSRASSTWVAGRMRFSSDSFIRKLLSEN
jgi:hypothetical protein